MKQEKEIVTIANYQKLAMRTCLPKCKNKDYAYWGYKSEFAELESKRYGLKAKTIRGDSAEKLAQVEKNIIDEIGDCFWFIALKCTLAKKSFEKLYKMKIADVKGVIELELKQSIEALKSICKTYDTFPLTCMRSNIAKLTSRAERGVIKGNGDER
jgi:hypothetical protein